MAKGKKNGDNKSETMIGLESELASKDSYYWVHPNVKKKSSPYDDQESIAYFWQSAWLLANRDRTLYVYPLFSSRISFQL